MNSMEDVKILVLFALVVFINYCACRLSYKRGIECGKRKATEDAIKRLTKERREYYNNGFSDGEKVGYQDGMNHAKIIANNEKIIRKKKGRII